MHVPEGTKVVRSDFTYHSLVQAFREQRFVVDMVACMELKQRKILIDAIVDAGVERLIPGEFSSNMENEAMIALWEMHVDRVEVRKYLKQKAAEKSSFSWTTVTVGPFYDWVGRPTTSTNSRAPYSDMLLPGSQNRFHALQPRE